MASFPKQNSSSSFHPLDTDVLKNTHHSHFGDRPPTALDANPPATKRSVVSNSRYFSHNSKFERIQSLRKNSQIQARDPLLYEGHIVKEPRASRNVKVGGFYPYSGSLVKRHTSGRKTLKKQGSTATLRKKPSISPRSAWPNKRKLSNSNSKYIRKVQTKKYISDGSSSASPPKPDAKLNSDLFFPDEGRTRHIEQVMMGPGIGLGSLLSSSLFDSHGNQKKEGDDAKTAKTTEQSFSPKRMSPNLKRSKLLRSSRKSMSSFKKAKKEPDFGGALGITKKPTQPLDSTGSVFQRNQRKTIGQKAMRKNEQRPSSGMQKNKSIVDKIGPSSQGKNEQREQVPQEIVRTEFASPGLFSSIEKQTIESNRGTLFQNNHQLFHSPIITGTIRSVSPFTNDNLGIPSINQEMIESRPASGKKRVTDTLLQYEAALLSLEKENKAINEALKKKKQESESKEEEMLKLRAKNQNLLRKLRIRVSKSSQNQDSQTRQILSKNPGTIRGLPNYLYSNPAKVLQYLKRNSISSLRTSHTDIKEPSSFIVPPQESDNKFVSVGPAVPVSDLLSLGSRPTNFQTYLTMKRYANPHGNLMNNEKLRESEIQGSSNQSPRLFSSFERGSYRYEMPLQMSTPQLPRQKCRDLSPCFVLKGTSYVRPSVQITRNKLFRESTKQQLKRAREAAEEASGKLKTKNQFEEQPHSIILT